MSSAFKVQEFICWGSAATIEDILSRIADLSAKNFGSSDPLSIHLAEEQSLYWAGKVVELQVPTVSLIHVAAVLNSAREQALASGTFTEIGISWLNDTFKNFCTLVALMAQTNGV